MKIEVKHVQIARVDLHENGPSPVVSLGGLPRLDNLDLIRVVDEDAHVSADRGKLISESREICDLVGRHREAVENLLRIGISSENRKHEKR